MAKPTLCLDFDGVIHSYTSGWQGAAIIPDPPVPGAMAFLFQADEVFAIAIHSSRSHQSGGILAMRSWLLAHLMQFDPADNERVKGLLSRIQFPMEKPAAFVTIDDRALTFTGDFAAFDPQRLLEFKPWNKK